MFVCISVRDSKKERERETWLQSKLSCTVTERCAAILALGQNFMMCKYVSNLHGQQQNPSFPTSVILYTWLNV